MPRRQPLGHLPEHLGVFHPPSDEVEIEALDVVRVEILEHLLVGAFLRHRPPRLLVGARRLVDDGEQDRGHEGDEGVASGDMDRIVGKRTGSRKVKTVFERADVVGLEHERHAPRRLATQHRHRPGWDLQKHRDPLP